MAAKKKGGSRSRKAAKRSKRTGTRKTAKAAARASATRKPTARQSTARKSTAKKSTARKSTTRKSITRKAARGLSTLRQSLVRSLPDEGVGAAVKEKARQGFELAREGLERLKDTTVGVTATVIENVKERVSREDDRLSESARAEPGESEPPR
jgi:hypothetical protein